MWHLRAEDDRKNPALEYRGEKYGWEQLRELRSGENIEAQIEQEVKNEHGLISSKKLPKGKFDAIVLTVAHNEFKNIDFSILLKEINVIYDVKNILPNSLTDRTL